jgi:limonene-1,2-epoxide hydrolase
MIGSGIDDTGGTTMTELEEANAALARTLFARWGSSNAEMRQTFLDYFSDDCLFQQTRLPDLVGGEQSAAFIDAARGRGIETVAVKIRTLVAQDRFVASERIDYLKDRDGNVLRTIPAVGFMEIVDGKIIGWRDYFDSALLVSPAVDA